MGIRFDKGQVIFKKKTKKNIIHFALEPFIQEQLLKIWKKLIIQILQIKTMIFQV